MSEVGYAVRARLTEQSVEPETLCRELVPQVGPRCAEKAVRQLLQGEEFSFAPTRHILARCLAGVLERYGAHAEIVEQQYDESTLRTLADFERMTDQAFASVLEAHNYRGEAATRDPRFHAGFYRRFVKDDRSILVMFGDPDVRDLCDIYISNDEDHSLNSIVGAKDPTFKPMTDLGEETTVPDVLALYARLLEAHGSDLL